MASLLAQLARGMIFAHRNFGELSKKRAKKRDHARICKIFFNLKKKLFFIFVLQAFKNRLLYYFMH